jgi:hypothetical protein
MALPKMKMLTSKGKVPKQSPLSSGKAPSPLMQLAGGKKDYRKKKSAGPIPSFGQTGMTGES